MTEESGDMTEVLQQKAEKDYLRIKNLTGEKNKMRDLIENLKFQLS